MAPAVPEVECEQKKHGIDHDSHASDRFVEE